MNRMMVAVVVAPIMSFAGQAKVDALVLDWDTSNPIGGALVQANFSIDNGWKAWTESAVPNVCRERTKEDGSCRLRGETNDGSVDCFVVKCPTGHYIGNGWWHKYTKKDIFGNWQPDNLVATIRLQRVEHPIPLFVRRVEWKDWGKGLLGLQGTNAVLRLDMFKGDWLPPYGHGETADLEIASEFLITGKERRFLRSIASDGDVLFYDLVQTIRPTGADDCIYESVRDPRLGIKIRRGSDDGRSGRIVRRQGRRKRVERTGNWECEYFNDTDANRCATFRIRSRYDEKGNLVEAYYGKIYGDFTFEGHLNRGVIAVRFLYYLNPTPLDRNLEWDMKNNLCPAPDNAFERRP